MRLTEYINASYARLTPSLTTPYHNNFCLSTKYFWKIKKIEIKLEGLKKPIKSTFLCIYVAFAELSACAVNITAHFPSNSNIYS